MRPERRWLGLLVCAQAALLTGCASEGPNRTREIPEVVPVPSRGTLAAQALSDHLQVLQRLLQSNAATQAEIVAAAQHDYDLAPTPSHAMRLALVLGTLGHPAHDLPHAQKLLRELLAAPEMITDGERALAQVQLQQIDDILTLESENRRLQAEAARTDRDRVQAANRRLQAEADENARLRRDLEEARAKLDAIANIERSLNARKPNNEGRGP